MKFKLSREGKSPLLFDISLHREMDLKELIQEAEGEDSQDDAAVEEAVMNALDGLEEGVDYQSGEGQSDEVREFNLTAKGALKFIASLIKHARKKQ
ncbi:MAG: hypothetical protein Q4P72_03535 [Eubacteriales bacterium]|nr:hypothetical protein [Eubacteriales bacterium]